MLASDDRSPGAAPNLYRNRAKALVAVGVGIVAGYVIGVPLSFVSTGHHSRPWEPFDIVISGSIWASVITVFTVIIAVLMQRYVTLYRNGQRVAATVVSEKHLPGGNRGVAVQFVHSSNEQRFSWIPNSQLPVGAQTTTIVGPATSKLVLNQNDPLGYARGSALTHAQITQILSGGGVGGS